MRKGDAELIKQINQNLVLNLVRSRGPISRTDVARLSGLSIAAVSGLTASLLEQDFLREVGEGESTGGRPPVLLKLNPRGGYVVGLKLTEESIISVLTDLEASVIYSRRTPVAAGADVDAAMDSICQAVEATLVESLVPRAKVMGIGIGLAGVIDSRAGVCRYSPFLGWRNVQLVQPIVERFRLPVFIENDVNALTIAEQWFGSGHDLEHFLVVTLGRGIGLGIVLNGQLYHGARGGAGEFGHLTINEDGPVCDCGKRGCLESIASDPAIVQQARQFLAVGRSSTLASLHDDTVLLTFDEIVQAAESGDSLARELLSRSGRFLGIGLAHLFNLFNPELIIISGEGVRAGEARLGPMRETLHQHVFRGLADQVNVSIESLDDEAWSRGAACVVLGELFKHPIHKERFAEQRQVA